MNLVAAISYADVERWCEACEKLGADALGDEIGGRLSSAYPFPRGDCDLTFR